MSDLKQTRDEFEDYIGWRPPRWKMGTNGSTYYDPEMESRWQDFLQGWNRRTQPEAIAPSQEPIAFNYSAPFKVFRDKHDVVFIEDSNENSICDFNTHTQRSLDDKAGIEADTQEWMKLADFMASALNAASSPANALSAGDRVDAVDAQRYRYIRDTATLDNAVWEALEGYWLTNDAGELMEDEYRAGMDRAIDRAILQSQKGNKV